MNIILPFSPGGVRGTHPAQHCRPDAAHHSTAAEDGQHPCPQRRGG